MRIPVHKQRDVISRIALHQKESSRSISEALGVAPNSVLTLRKAYEGAGLSAEVLEQLDDDQWRSKLGTADRTITRRKRAPDWEFIHEQMGLPDASLMSLWTDFKQEHPDGIGISQFHEG